MSNIHWIREIPYFKVGGREVINRELETLIKSKLMDSEYNADILRLARGEGRGVAIQKIINLPSLLFSWGEKAMCAYSDTEFAVQRNSDIIAYVSPNNIDKKMLKVMINDAADALDYHRIQYLNFNKEVDIDNFKRKLNYIIDNEDTHEKLLEIKEYMLYLLHTSRYKRKYRFCDVSPMISMSMGEDRVSIAKKFTKTIPTMASGRSIIYDYWLPVNEENRLFKKLECLRERLREDNLYWYKDYNREVMVKYTLFPQYIVGYYYFEGDNLKYYEVSPHYLELIKNCDRFKIGNPVYIDQSNVDFQRSEYKKIPFTHIYMDDGKEVSVFSSLID